MGTQPQLFNYIAPARFFRPTLTFPMDLSRAEAQGSQRREWALTQNEGSHMISMIE
jgi:hypothetical protein